VFFDNLKLDWIYEPQGYVLSDGTPYLPDFWVPRKHETYKDAGYFVEIKGAPPSVEEMKKFQRLSQDLPHKVYLVWGNPITKNGGYLLFLNGVCTQDDYYSSKHCLYVSEPRLSKTAKKYGVKLEPRSTQDSESFCIEGPTFRFALALTNFGACEYQWDFINTVTAFRSARFEHGDSP
jgi:hypothetical protein